MSQFYDIDNYFSKQQTNKQTNKQEKKNYTYRL